jgi:phage baseplate assembly protein gpV
VTRDTQIDKIIADLGFRLAELERRARNRKRTGVVAEVDIAKGVARVEFSRQDGRPYLGPWMPWKEIAAGGIKTHIPPTVGEQVDVHSESGDLADGVIDMSTPSNQNPRPHDGPEAVITKGNSRIVIGDGEVSISSTKLKIAADVEITGRLDVTGAGVTHNDHDIGDSHVHTKVVPGGALSGPPP